MFPTPVFASFFSLTNCVVAVKEIRINQEEGLPFTAIREGKLSRVFNSSLIFQYDQIICFLFAVVLASLLKSLRHANIVTLHDIVHTKLTLNFVFEYVVSPKPFSIQVVVVFLLKGAVRHPVPLFQNRDLWLETTGP